jgi:hypothetical protein
MSRIGVVMLIGGAIVLALGLTGISDRVPCLVMGTVLSLIGTTIYVIGRSIGSSFERDVSLVRELAVRGIRRRGTVKDALPYTTPRGVAVVQPEGAQMVLRIELDSETGHRRTVTCQLVENTAEAKDRIGRSIEILEHPEHPNIRAIAGYLPNGRKAS